MDDEILAYVNKNVGPQGQSTTFGSYYEIL